MGKQNLEKTEQKKFNFTPSVRREFEKFCERMSITEQDAAMAGCLWLAQSDPARMTQIMVNLHTFRQKAQAQSATPAEPVELADPAQTPGLALEHRPIPPAVPAKKPSRKGCGTSAA